MAGADLRPNSRRKQGFTVLELLIVISVIAILAGILIIGSKHIIGGSKARQTRVALENLRGMLGNLDAATKLKNQPAGWLWYQSMQSNNLVDPSSPPYDTWNLDFWRVPNRGYMSAISGGPIVPPGPTAPADALDAPGVVAAEGSDQVAAMRNASNAVLNTSVAMGLILAQP